MELYRTIAKNLPKKGRVYDFEREHVELKITISNVPRYHARKLLGLLKTMEKLGSVGASRDLTFFSDGDGDFRPKVRYEADRVGARTNMFITRDDPFSG